VSIADIVLATVNRALMKCCPDATRSSIACAIPQNIRFTVALHVEIARNEIFHHLSALRTVICDNLELEYFPRCAASRSLVLALLCCALIVFVMLCDFLVLVIVFVFSSVLCPALIFSVLFCSVLALSFSVHLSVSVLLCPLTLTLPQLEPHPTLQNLVGSMSLFMPSVRVAPLVFCSLCCL
jgi:hypothetical protein